MCEQCTELEVVSLLGRHNQTGFMVVSSPVHNQTGFMVVSSPVHPDWFYGCQ